MKYYLKIENIYLKTQTKRPPVVSFSHQLSLLTF